MTAPKVLVTGAGGFVGRALCEKLHLSGVEVVAVVRGRGQPKPPQCSCLLERDLTLEEPWDTALTGVDVVFHLAARAHQTCERGMNLREVYWQNNVDPTKRLATAAARVGVRKFVYLSSIKALGDVDPGRAWREDDTPHPLGAYGASKLAAETILGDASMQTKLRTTVIRPPLVYGPGVRANFFSLLRAVDLRWPLPLANATAPRSLIFLDNLIDAMIFVGFDDGDCTPTVLHVADALDISVSQLVFEMATRLERSVRLLPFPINILRMASSLIGKTDRVDRMVKSQRVDTSRIRNVMGWSPPCTLAQGLDATVAWYRQEFPL